MNRQREFKAKLNLEHKQISERVGQYLEDVEFVKGRRQLGNTVEREGKGGEGVDRSGIENCYKKMIGIWVVLILVLGLKLAMKFYYKSSMTSEMSVAS